VLLLVVVVVVVEVGVLNFNKLISFQSFAVVYPYDNNKKIKMKYEVYLVYLWPFE